MMKIKNPGTHLVTGLLGLVMIVGCGDRDKKERSEVAEAEIIKNIKQAEAALKTSSECTFGQNFEVAVTRKLKNFSLATNSALACQPYKKTDTDKLKAQIAGLKAYIAVLNDSDAKSANVAVKAEIATRLQRAQNALTSAQSRLDAKETEDSVVQTKEELKTWLDTQLSAVLKNLKDNAGCDVGTDGKSVSCTDIDVSLLGEPTRVTELQKLIEDRKLALLNAKDFFDNMIKSKADEVKKDKEATEVAAVNTLVNSFNAENAQTLATIKAELQNLVSDIKVVDTENEVVNYLDSTNAANPLDNDLGATNAETLWTELSLDFSIDSTSNKYVINNLGSITKDDVPVAISVKITALEKLSEILQTKVIEKTSVLTNFMVGFKGYMAVDEKTSLENLTKIQSQINEIIQSIDSKVDELKAP